MKIILIAAAILASPLALHATPQTGDKLTHGEETLWVHGFELNKKLEAQIKRIESQRDYTIYSTANYDGFYVALEMRDKKLYLTKLWIDASSKDFKDGVQPVPLTINGKPTDVFAVWFSGDLVHYHGDSLGYTHLMSQMRIMNFKNGVLVKTEDKPVTQRGGEQGGPDQPATAPESKSEGKEKPKPESEERSQ